MRRVVTGSNEAATSSTTPLLPQGDKRGKVGYDAGAVSQHSGSVGTFDTTHDDLNSMEDGRAEASSAPSRPGGLRHFWTSSSRHLETWTKFLHRSHLNYRRIMDRAATYNQSFGRWNIRRVREGVVGLKELYEQDQFHTILNMDTSYILVVLLMGYILVVTGFAVMYLLLALVDGCNMGIENLREAYYFSLETMTTVGYGTKDIFFGGCWSVLFVVTAQACVGLLIDAALIGILFARLSRPQTRAATVVFSRNAVIRRVRGEFFLMFQVGELRKHQLLDAHVRCYVIRHDRMLPPARAPPGVDPELYRHGQGSDTVYFQTHYMRLQHPDDELGSSMLLVLPQLVVHRIDAWSPMMPPPRWMSAQGIVQWGLHGDADYVKAPWEAAAEAKAAAKAKVAASGDYSKNDGAAAAAAAPVEVPPQRSALDAGASAARNNGVVDILGAPLPMVRESSTTSNRTGTGGEKTDMKPFWEERPNFESSAENSAGKSARADSAGRPQAEAGKPDAAPAGEPISRSLFKRQSSYWDCEFQQYLPELQNHANTAAFAGNAADGAAGKQAAAAAGSSGGGGGGGGDGYQSPATPHASDAERGPGYVYRFPDLLKRWDDVDGDRGTWYERMKRRVMTMEQARREFAEEEAKRKEADREKRHRERQHHHQNTAATPTATSSASASASPPLPPLPAGRPFQAGSGGGGGGGGGGHRPADDSGFVVSGDSSRGARHRKGFKGINSRRSIMEVPTANHPMWGHYGKASSFETTDEKEKAPGLQPAPSDASAASAASLDAGVRRTSKLFRSLRAMEVDDDEVSRGHRRQRSRSSTDVESDLKQVLQRSIPRAFEAITDADKDRAQQLGLSGQLDADLDGADSGNDDNLSEEGSEAGETVMDPHVWFGREEKKAITAFMVDREVEIICILEGIDTSTGATVQSRHSYAFCDVLWDHAFDQCVFRDEDGACVVDFNKFHDVRPCPPDVLDFGFVQSYA